jgi:hypothetical protein
MNLPVMPRRALLSHRLLGALAAGIIILAAFRALVPSKPRLVPPVSGESEAFARGPFAEHADCASDADLPPGLATRGSWVNGDAFTGTFVSGWYQARPRVTLMVSGYPRGPGNQLALEVRTTAGAVRRLVYGDADPREHWRPWRIVLPPEAAAFRIVAQDGSTALRGWLGVSQPAAAGLRLAFLPEAPRALLAFLGQAVLLLVMTLALRRCLGSHLSLPAGLVPFVAVAGVAVLGYLAFWCYFASPLFGRVFSWTVLAVSAVMVARPAKSGDGGADELLPPLALAGVTGLGFVALTCLFGDAPFSQFAASRFMLNLPVDNEIPRMFADRLWSGQSPRHLLGDWLSSDRPPLQAGWLLLTRPVLAALGFDGDTVASVGGVWFQLMWVPAMWAILRRFGAGPRAAAAMVAAMACTGFQLFNTVYTWPKLGAAALVLGMFVLWRPESDESACAGRFAAGGICAALGFLAHGGVAFSLLGFVPLGLVSLLRERHAWRRWLVAGTAFAVTAAPWAAYQKYYEPPGNRLLKWHLAGVIPPDSRSFGETLVDSYRQLGWHGALANRLNNLQLQWAGDWRNLLRFKPGASLLWCRADTTTFTGLIFGWWMLAALALPWIIWRRRKEAGGILSWALAWWISGWLVWLALMFLPDSARAHEGTLVTQLLGFSLLMWTAFSLHRLVFLALAMVQMVLFFGQWVSASPALTGAMNPLAAAVALAAALGLAGVVLRGTIPGKSGPAVPL